MHVSKKVGAGLAVAGVLGSTMLFTGGTSVVAQPEGTLRAVAVTTEDGGQGDEGVGSTFAAGGDLYRRINGNRRNVGRFGFNCVVTSVEEEEANCSATVDIDRGRDEGQITVQGLLGDGRRQSFAITGGTGDFENAGGELRTFDVNDQVTVLTFHFAD